MSKNKKILFSGIFLATVIAILLVAPTKIAHGWLGDAVAAGFYYIIYGIFLAISNLLNVAGILFDWAVDPQNFTDVLNTQAVLNGWKMVRDLFNVAFILVLLFSAFSTIFQVESFHIGKIWLRLVIIALLVNFSYPIALFIIDASNVLMYFFLNTAFPDNGNHSMISASWAHWTGITDAMVPRNASGSLNTDATDLFKKLVLAMIMIFVLMATIITMGILLIIRIVVLAILVILAPAGFVAGILPSTKNYSDDWWKNLFKYSFMGPALAFMIVLGLKMMSEMNEDRSLASVKRLVSANTSNTGDPDLISKLVFFSIPIVIMWSGMIVAQKLGVAGAGFAVKVGQGAAKKFSGFNAVKKRYDAYSAERKKRADEKFKGNWGAGLGKLANRGQDWAHGAVSSKGEEIRDSQGNIIGRAKSTGNKFTRFIGATNAKNRHRQMLIDKNKEDIKKQHEDLEGASASELHRVVHGLNLADPNTTHDQKIKAAAHARQAISRGKEYEDQLSRQGLNEAQIREHRAKMREAIQAAELSKTHEGGRGDQAPVRTHEEVQREHAQRNDAAIREHERRGDV